MNDVELAVCAIAIAAIAVLLLIELRKRYTRRVLTETAVTLRSFGNQIDEQRKAYLQDEAWKGPSTQHPFLRAHLNRKVRMHNELVDEIRKVAKSL